MPIIRKIVEKLNTYNYDHVVDYYIDPNEKIILNTKNDFDTKIVEFYNFLIDFENMKNNRPEIIKKIEEIFENNNKKINNNTELINMWIDNEKILHILVKATYWYEISVEFIYDEDDDTYAIINATISSQTGRGGFNRYKDINIDGLKERDVLEICSKIVNDNNSEINKLIQMNLSKNVTELIQLDLSKI